VPAPAALRLASNAAARATGAPAACTAGYEGHSGAKQWYKKDCRFGGSLFLRAEPAPAAPFLALSAAARATGGGLSPNPIRFALLQTPQHALQVAG